MWNISSASQNLLLVWLFMGLSLFVYDLESLNFPPVSPLSRVYVLHQSVNCFGDHLLECSHGPMRIRCHDALVDIACHALSQSYPGVLKEQRVSCEDHSCPVMSSYHPDFQCGRPAYFDESVHSITQSSYISSASTCTGVAAAAGELAKDKRHQDAIEEQGVILFLWWWKPLVCDCPSLYLYCRQLLIAPQLVVGLLPG